MIKKYIWIIVASILVMSGIIGATVVLAVNNWDFNSLSVSKIQTNTYQISEEFSDISINIDTADIILQKSSDNIVSVSCVEYEDSKHIVKVENGVLYISVENNVQWYSYLGFRFAKTSITVSLPNDIYDEISIKSNTGDIEIAKELGFTSIDIQASTGKIKNYANATDFIKIKTTTGEINASNLSAKTVDLTVSTGKIKAENLVVSEDVTINIGTGYCEINNLTCVNFTNSGSTGDVTLNSVITSGKMDISRTTGDINFNGCDGAEIEVKTNTGTVEGALKSGKNFEVSTSTGYIDIPQNSSGGLCKIITITGDIKIRIE